ncbi:MAG: sugar phosphate isomerase/epimerase [Anaerolineaceae bacterium]|nr:sugar phosphate isomerase/epimerase [Anaerolineaceae bacterium]MDE0329176.1 sugar phosphate isomerase/epimerase [Anaerolineaceae bacterium]
MFSSLDTGAIGISGHGLERSLALAQRFGYGGVDFDIREAAQLAGERGIDELRDLFARHKARPGNWGLPVNWEDDDWEEDLERLPALAQVAQELGALRTTTVCWPHSETRPFEENFEWHRKRFGRIAETLLPFGIRVGFEFIGPRTFPPPDAIPFINDMSGMLRLCEAIGTGNAGILLDAYHLHTSGGGVSDLDALSADQVVAVHVNDAPLGLTLDTYMDLDRRLPTETGVIDLAGFMQRLEAMGYDGPVTCEPFSARTNAIEDPCEAAQLVTDHMRRMWQQAGLDWS